MGSKTASLRKAVAANARESMRPKVARPETKGKPEAPPKPDRMKGAARIAAALSIPLDRIIADPDQPRKTFDEESLERLSESLKSKGQLQPIRVRWSEPADRYVVIAGERRFRGAMLAGLATMDCIVDDRPVDATLLLVDQLVENCARVDLSQIDQAEAMRSLLEREGWTQARLAKDLGISQPSVSKTLALLDLPQDLIDQVVDGELSAAVARELGRVEDPEARHRLIERAMTEQWGKRRAADEVDNELEDAEDYSPRINAGPDDPGDPDDPTPEDAEDYSPGIIPGPRPLNPALPSKALPDWRDRPAMGLGLPAALANRLAKDGIESAGEAWGLLEGGVLCMDLGWPYLEAKNLEKALLEIREEAGDPDPFVASFDFGPVVMPAPKRTCRECGCTDDDCRQCIEKTGRPCQWVEPDLCSACLLPERPSEGEVADIELRRAIGIFQGHEERWAEAAKTGLSDVDLFAKIGSEMGIGGSTTGFWHGRRIGYKGGKNPAIFIPDYPWSKRPTLYGAKLRDRVRALLSIPYPGAEPHEVEGRAKPVVEPRHARLVDLLPDLEWRRTPFCQTSEVVVVELDGIEAVFRCDEDRRPTVALLALAREVVANLERRLGR